MSSDGTNNAGIVGRRVECDSVDHLLAEAQAGRSGALVVRGEAGIGKSALLEHARDNATAAGFRVETSVGVESEAQFAFAGLHQMCTALLDRIDTLPEPQHAALSVAFGLRGGAAPDRFLVGLAALNLLAEVAEHQPLLCIVDDAQWIDEASAQVLAFIARRLAAEQVAILFALRDPTDRDIELFAGLHELRLDGLNDPDARTLLSAAVHAPLDDRVRDQIIAEARGNPLALLELPRHAHPGHLAGGFELPDALSVPRRVEDAFQRRSRSLPADTQMLLLIAAAEPTGDAELFWRAAANLDIAREAAEPAEAAELIEIDARVRFRHSLVRSAVYQAATPPDQRRAHGALAAAIDEHADPDRRAWHRARAVLGTDEDTASELERSSGRARARGGLAASAAFLHRAAELTPDPGHRATRALAAAHAKHDAGASEAATELLTVASAGPLDEQQHAQLKLLHAQIAFDTTRRSDAVGMLLDAARTLAPLDPALSRETYLHALEAAIITGGRGLSDGVREVAQAASSAPAAPESPEASDLLLDGLVTTCARGYEASVPELRRALQALCTDEPTESGRDTADRRWLWLASRTAVALFDDDLVYALATRNVKIARESGALGALPAALSSLSVTLAFIGEFAQATELAAEETAIRTATGAEPLRNRAQLILAGWQAQQPDTDDPHSVPDLGSAVDPGPQVSMAQYARAVLHNGLGNYSIALDAATRACELDELLNGSMALPELIEAAVRTGQPERATSALEQLSSRADASGTNWALGVAACARALTATGPTADKHYREAIERLSQSRITTHLARAHLVYGEWLRRERRRQDARTQLRTAHQMLSDMGAEAFAERAASELRATGEHPRKRTAQPTDDLTAQEMHIARYVAAGATNREVGAQLFLSPRTIEAHLRSIFRKLDITSRRQLRDVQLP